MDLNEIKTHYRSMRMGIKDKIESFDCGDTDLNDFILNDASKYREVKLAVSYLVFDKYSKESVAFFSLANDRVSLSDFGNNTELSRFRKQRFVNGRRLKSYPTVKLCRLGVTSRMQKNHCGKAILLFIKTYFTEDNKTGCRFLTVDAYAKAIPFYERNGFVPLNDDDKDESTRLMYFDFNDVD